MKKFFGFLFSGPVTLVLLVLFAVSIGTATFIEEKYDTVTARLLVYNAWWFELIMLLLAVNFIGNISRFRLYRKGKRANLAFHLAFVMLIVGAGITRYISFEGMVHIREGETTNVMLTSDPYLMIRAAGKEFSYASEKKVWLTPGGHHQYKASFEIPGEGTCKITLKKYLSNAVTRIDENCEGGKDILQMVVSGKNGSGTLLLEEGETKRHGGELFAFDTVSGDSTLRINDTVMEFTAGRHYRTENSVVIFVRRFIKATREWVQGGPQDQGVPMLFFEVSLNGITRELAAEGGPDLPAVISNAEIGGYQVGIAYGSKERELPFSLRLDDFILDRYAGSMSPSSFASEVTLIDPRENLQEKHRIYMNHVLDHDGYRFFQSSYDLDEKGTILSVNHDFWGTWISYAGYILLGIGFILALAGKGSRFRTLSRRISGIREERKKPAALLVLLFVLAGGTLNAQTPPNKPVSAGHAEKFGELLVETFDGRFEPVHTLANDVMHKIARKDHFETGVKGDLDNVQVFLDMVLDPEFWRQQKIVYVREKPVQDILGIDGKYASFYDFIDNNSNYKLRKYAEESFRKSPSQQNAFDKEIIRVDERLNVLLTVMDGSLLKVLPVKDSPNHLWTTFTDTLAMKPVNYSDTLKAYLTSVYQATATGDYSQADRQLARLAAIQRQLTPASLLPSESRVRLEVWYNRSGIFSALRNWYGIISVVLLTLAFIDNLSSKRRRLVGLAMNVFIVLLALAFLYHTFGLGLRWHLTGHAPWSNGYEAMLLVGWGSLLAGFSFMRYSKITLAATAVLAFSVLMTAGHSSYDPQLTNLQPVLKSYWLIIHVAVITISYGFLAVGFILGLINLFLYVLMTKRNSRQFGLIIKELTLTNEMALLVGIVLATLGTFLGGVWANESWGRYWGWDAKEAWALVIVITYAIILHLRLVPKLQNDRLFNAASVVGFGSVIMTFVGVNYFLTKGLHSYAAGEKSVFPVWAWLMILAVAALIAVAFGRKH